MSEETYEDPLDELQRENDTTQGLLERLVELSELVRSGREVLPGEIADGLRLLKQYVTLHARRFDRELQPEARPVAMDTCHPHLDHVIEEHAGILHQVEVTQGLVSDFERGGDRTRLAEGLDVLTNQDYAELTYERDYPLSCLITALPDDAAHRVAGQFAGSREALEDLERHIRRYLAVPAGQSRTPLHVHCAGAGCPETAVGEVAPGHGGRLALLAPEGGWTMKSREARPAAGGVVHLVVDYICPHHSAETSENDGGRLA